MDRKEIRVDVLPSKTWPIEQLISLGLQHGVDFGLKTDEEGVLIRNLSPEIAVAKLYEQLEFIELQDPVAESMAKRSDTSNMFSEDSDLEWIAKVVYKGNGLMPFTWDGKTQFFMPGIPYEFKKEHAELIRTLQENRCFSIEWIPQELDSMVATLRRTKASMYDIDDLDKGIELIFVDSRKGY